MSLVLYSTSRLILTSAWSQALPAAFRAVSHLQQQGTQGEQLTIQHDTHWVLKVLQCSTGVWHVVQAWPRRRSRIDRVDGVCVSLNQAPCGCGMVVMVSVCCKTYEIMLGSTCEALCDKPFHSSCYPKQKSACVRFPDIAGVAKRNFRNLSTSSDRHQESAREPAARKSLLALLGGHTHNCLLPDLRCSRKFTVAASAAAAAAQPQSTADDVVAQVLSCAATNNTETGVLAQVGGGVGMLLLITLVTPVFGKPTPLSMVCFLQAVAQGKAMLQQCSPIWQCYNLSCFLHMKCLLMPSRE